MSELKPRLACTVGHGLHTTVVEEPVSIENHLIDALVLRDPCDGRTDLLGGVDVARRPLSRDRPVPRGSSRERPPRLVLDELGVGVLAASIDGEQDPIAAVQSRPRPVLPRLPHPTLRIRDLLLHFDSGLLDLPPRADSSG